MISYKETAIGLVDYDEVWSTYQENLRLSPNEALELAGDISKRRFISSNYGNLVGERT